MYDYISLGVIWIDMLYTVSLELTGTVFGGAITIVSAVTATEIYKKLYVNVYPCVIGTENFFIVSN